MFGRYDRVDYSGKNIPELKSQLQTQIFLLQASRQVFTQENPGIEWRLPRNFNEEPVVESPEYTLLDLDADSHIFRKLTKYFISGKENNFERLFRAMAFLTNPRIF